MWNTTILKSVIKVIVVLLAILQFSELSSCSAPYSEKKQKKRTKLSKLFSKKCGKCNVKPKDGSLLFPALKAVAENNFPILKNVRSLDYDYDEDILDRSKVYIIKNGEVPGWDGMMIPIHFATDDFRLRLRPPEEDRSVSILPPVVIERFMLFALEECLLPSKFFLQVSFCTFDAIYPFLEGTPSGEVMQDITGAAMYSINKIKGDFVFDLDYCLRAIEMIPDKRLNSDANLKCHNISLCMHQDLLPQLSPSLSTLSWDQLIEKSFVLHGLEYQLMMNRPIESILWDTIKFARKSRKWKNYNNPNRLFMIIRAYILALYVRHSSMIIPGWYINKFPPAKRALSFVYVKNEDYTDQSVFVDYCARKLKEWLNAFQPFGSSILPNIKVKDEVSRSACFQAGRAGFVSSDKFDFTNMIEEGTENVDLLNLQLPVILSRSEGELEYIRNNNLRAPPENRKWTSLYESHPYSLNDKLLQIPMNRDETNTLQNLVERDQSSRQGQNYDSLLEDVYSLMKQKKDEVFTEEENVPSSPTELLARLERDNLASADLPTPKRKSMHLRLKTGVETESGLDSYPGPSGRLGGGHVDQEQEQEEEEQEQEQEQEEEED